jgi:hypothetical protein
MKIKIEWKIKDDELFTKKKIFFSGLLVLLFLTFRGSIIQAEMTSNSYIIESDVIGSFGDREESASYQLEDTGGETATGDSASSSYEQRAGFWPAVMDYKIAISCDSTVVMGQISGTGQSDLSTNEAVCTIKTDNPTGYALTFVSDTNTMMNSESDQIYAYTPSLPGNPEQWSVSSSDSEWGARLKSSSDEYDTAKWGTVSGGENYSSSDAYWHNVTDSSSFTIIAKTNETTSDGDSEILQFGAEVGANKIQPTGTYAVEVTITATTL